MMQASTQAGSTIESNPTPYERVRQHHLQHLRSRIPVLLERLDWTADRLKAHREARLRELVSFAQLRSPWHRRRLAGIDAQRLTEDDLQQLPVMNKDDLMAHFDEIVTDSTLNLERCERHLASLQGDAYLCDRYHVNASGGSSGRRGIAVWDWDGWADGWASFLRWLMRLQRREPAAAPNRLPMVTAGIAALDPTHMSSALPRSFNDPTTMVMHRFPVTQPYEQIVAGVNDLQPDIVIGYSSMLHRLACSARDGQLRVAPKVVVCVSEPLLPEIRAAIDAAWQTRVLNYWATTEAMTMAMSCGFGPGMHLNDDGLIIEPVDRQGQAVPPGQRAAKLFVTNLMNAGPLPLIRYEITDEVTLLESSCPCGSAHRLIDDVQGRLDDMFTYPGVGTIHPHVFRSRLTKERHVVEYQVKQTERGADITICCSGEVDTARLRAALSEDLRTLGLAEPVVNVMRGDAIERQCTGKLKRLVPLVSH